MLLPEKETWDQASFTANLGGKTSLDPSFFFSFAKISPPIIGLVPKTGPSHPLRAISTGAQNVTLDNKIKCLSLAVFLLTTPPIKL
jgi:hypothetical protein